MPQTVPIDTILEEVAVEEKVNPLERQSKSDYTSLLMKQIDELRRLKSQIEALKKLILKLQSIVSVAEELIVIPNSAVQIPPPLSAREAMKTNAMAVIPNPAAEVSSPGAGAATETDKMGVIEDFSTDRMVQISPTGWYGSLDLAFRMSCTQLKSDQNKK